MKVINKNNKKVTIGGVYHSKEVQLKNNMNYKLHLWDTGSFLYVILTAGEERFSAMLSLYYRDANIAVFVYDI